MTNNNKNDKNKGSKDNYDRRPVVDPPSAEDKQAPVVSAKRKGFYIILLLGITAIGIYAILSSLLTKPEPNKPNGFETGSAIATAAPGRAVPANAAATPVSDPVASAPAAPSPTVDAAAAADTTDTGEATALAQAPVSGKIIKDFSTEDLVYSETMRDWRTHGGVDIAANLDTVVTAIKDGTLKKVYEDSLFGTTVVIHHEDDGTDSVYCNLKDALKDPIGTAIKTGDMVGRVGNTAISELNDEPHLHFEIKLDDTYLDPKQFVKFEEADYVQPESSGAPSATAESSAAAALSATEAPSSEAKTSATTAPTADPEIYGEDVETMIID